MALRVHVTRPAEKALRAGHPWLFSDSIVETNRPGTLGEPAMLFDRQDQFLGMGLWDPDSPMRVRVLHVGPPATLDDAWWRRHLQEAIDRRNNLFGADTTGYRLVHGENDRWPGLVLDRYDQTCVVKLYSAIWFPRLDKILDRIEEALRPERIVLRFSRNLQKAAEELRLRDGQVIRGGDLPEGRVLFLENGLRFEAEAAHGQKTGFFLDQRDNRRRIGELAAGRKTLNAFSYTGAFSVYAARGGAAGVVDLDVSARALNGGRRHFDLNQNLPAVRHCQRTAIQADAFKWLETGGEEFDLVILDPPSLAKKENERERAALGYERLAAAGWRRLRAGGIVAASSCSAHVSAAEFFEAVRRGARHSGAGRGRELLTTGHPADHPAGYPEAYYLKSIYLLKS